MGARERRHRPLLVLTRTRRATHTNKRFFHFAAEIGNNKFPYFIIIPCRAWGGKKTLVNSHKSQPLRLQRIPAVYVPPELRKFHSQHRKT